MITRGKIINLCFQNDCYEIRCFLNFFLLKFFFKLDLIRNAFSFRKNIIECKINLFFE